MYQSVQKQEGGDDCGVFSIAFATALLHNQNPVNMQFVQVGCILICFNALNGNP